MRALRHALPLVLLLAACERAGQSPPRDTAAGTPPEAGDSAGSVLANSGWNADAGPTLLIASDAPGVAEVVFPEVTDSTLGDSALMDLASVRGARIDLFSRRGEAGVAIVAGEDTTAQADSSEESCEDWPLVRLRQERAGPPGGWTLGLLSGRARAIALDSIEALSRSDSARLASEVARLASQLPDDTARAFRGLPYFVRTVRRFRPASGVQAIVADVSRRINQEANPREEQLLLVAERDVATANARWSVTFSERASGREGTVEAHEVLAALSIGAARRPTLVLSRYVGDGVSYALVERVGPGRWSIRWTSATSGC